jgi:hypothetical protein
LRIPRDHCRNITLSITIQPSLYLRPCPAVENFILLEAGQRFLLEVSLIVLLVVLAGALLSK